MKNREIIEKLAEIYRGLSKKESQLFKFLNGDGDFVGEECDKIHDLVRELLEGIDCDVLNDCIYHYLGNHIVDEKPYTLDMLYKDVERVANYE